VIKFVHFHRSEANILTFFLFFFNQAQSRKQNRKKKTFPIHKHTHTKRNTEQQAIRVE